MARHTPITVELVDLAAEAVQQVRAVFERDGMLDDEEHHALLSMFRLKHGAMRADESRKDGISVLNTGTAELPQLAATG